VIGTVLDETYRVVERIGAGSMGEVYLVEHIHIGRREAIKVLRPEMAADPRLAQRFRREARAINRLRHPNIIGIYDFGQLPDGRLYLTMEYAPGDTLDLELRRGRLELPRALHVLHQLAGGIDHAHAHGVVHRDLKPHNMVLVTERGRRDVVKVLDFGLAKVLAPGGKDDVTRKGELFGTPEYMAPERAAGGPDDPRSDLYSIGCIAYELISGRPPFTGSRSQVLSQHLSTTPPRIPQIPPLLDQLVQQMLAKIPRDRLQSGMQIVAALEQVPGFPKKKHPWRQSQIVAVQKTPGVEVHEEKTPTEGKPRAIGYADTASASTDEVRDEVFGALVEVGKQTMALGNDPELSVSLALVTGVRDDRTRIDAEQAIVEEQQQQALQIAREREGSLRFAIAELRFERPKASPDVVADLDYQINALDLRVRELTQDLAVQLHQLDERGIELAARDADLDGQWLLVHRRLRSALGVRLRSLGPAAGQIASRFATLDAALDQLL
jgi:serine/threonine protein kinase